MPYKNHISAGFSNEGRKSMSALGFYLEISAEKVKIYSGLYKLTSTELNNLRNHIKDNLKEFKKLYSDKKFIEVSS